MIRLSDEEVTALGERGYFVRDSFLGAELALRVRDAAIALRQTGAMKPAGIGREKNQTNSAVRTDNTYWPEVDEPSEALREAHAKFALFQDHLNFAAWLGLTRFELQLAHYGPGGNYQRHADAFAGDDNRRVTAIVYLNEHWKPADGGHLKIYAEPSVEVEPSLDRLVVFLSERIEHEVLPNHAERFALTAWYRSR